MIEFPDSPATGDLHAAGGASWRWDGVKWTVDTSGPLLHQGEVLGNPDPADAEAVPAGLATMLRADLGDGVAGQALLSGGAGIDPAWGIGEYIVGAFIPSAPTANQVLLHHPMGRAVTIPANFAAHAGYASRARVRVAATASYTILVQRATAAAPSTFSNVGTIVFAAGAFVGTFSTSGVDVAYAAGDTMALVAPATVDATLAGFSATLVAREG
jgi:hypothetical protein